MGKHRRFLRQDESVKRRATCGKAGQRRLPARAMVEPGGMHAVAGAEDHAAGNALVRLGDIVAADGHLVLGAAHEAAVARDTSAEQTRIARVADLLPEAFLRRALPVARDQRDLGALARQRTQRALDEALGAAVRIVTLADDGDADRADRRRGSSGHCASSSCTAPKTLSTGSETRQSLTLLPPQPSMPHGRHG